MDKYKQADYWTKKAIFEGYPARSVYKLAEMNEKFNLFTKNSNVLDLGAAPGSWTLFVLKFLDETGRVCSVDLQPLDSKIYDKRLSFFQGNMYDKNIMSEVKNESPFDTLICDAAPATTGNKGVDTTRSAALVELAIFYAQNYLKPNGNFVVKIFQGGEEQELLKTLRKLFKTVKTFKPKACRSTSFETYLIGLNFLPT
ncbi:MAG: 50S rRNA methyltransferase [Treponema sp.]|nr:MAG: 50S rRNA methyltransferase [Treponema sp.]